MSGQLNHINKWLCLNELWSLCSANLSNRLCRSRNVSVYGDGPQVRERCIGVEIESLHVLGYMSIKTYLKDVLCGNVTA